MDVLELLLAIGLTARIVRLAVWDDAGRILRRPAELLGQLVAGVRGRKFFEEMFFCPFCIGWWVSLAVAGSWAVAGETLAWRAVALAGTASYIAGHLVATLDGEQIRRRSEP